MLVLHDLLERPDDHPTVDDDPDPVADPEDGIQIVGNHHYRQRKSPLQLQHEAVEGRRRDRVEAGSRLVEEQDGGIEGEGPRQRRALGHAAGELGRVLGRRVLRAEPDHPDAQQREVLQHGLGHREVLADRQLDVLGDRQRGEQRAALEHDAVAPLDREQLAIRLPRDLHALDADRARHRLLQAEHRAQQHRLAAARAADDAEHLARLDVEVEAVMHDLAAEAVDDAARPG